MPLQDLEERWPRIVGYLLIREVELKDFLTFGGRKFEHQPNIAPRLIGTGRRNVSGDDFAGFIDDDVSLTLDEGITGLIGPNGAGRRRSSK